MSEVPDFLQGIDPEMVRDLDQHMDVEADRYLENYRQSYMSRVGEKMQIIDLCLDHPNAFQSYLLGMADEQTRWHFAFYVDKVFTAPSDIDKLEHLVEALDMADMTQMRLNERQTGTQRLYDTAEIRSIVAQIMLNDNQKEASQDIINMYDRSFREVIARFVFKK